MNNPTDHYDAIIVGARCAGASLALLLARQGKRVLVVDRARYGTDALSTHALMRTGMLQLAKWGILDALREAGTPTIDTTSFYYGSDAFHVDIAPRYGVDSLMAPRRWLLDRVLVDAATAAGAEVRFGCRLVSLLRDDDGTVTGAVVTEGGRPVEVRAGIVVGADGVRSTVARLVDASAYATAAHTSASVFAYVSELEMTGYHWYYVKDAAAGVIPTNNGHCVFVSVPPERMNAAGRDVRQLFSEALTECAPAVADALGEHATEGGLRRFPGHPGFMRTPSGPGWALVGDAGYFKDPLTAHGISDALRDAELLAAAIIDGRSDAYRHYRHTRDQLSHELFAITDRIASFDWDLPTVQQLHRQLSVCMDREARALPQLPGTDAAVAA